MSGSGDQANLSSQPKMSRKLLTVLIAMVIVIVVFLSVFVYRFYDADGWFKQEWSRNANNVCLLDMVIDEFDQVHIAYEEYAYGDSAVQVKYAVKKGSQWERTEAGFGSYYARDFQIHLGESDQVHVSLGTLLRSGSTSPPRIHYCILSDGKWTASYYPVDYLYDSRVALDSAGTPHLLTITKQYVDDGFKYELQHWTISSEGLTKKASYQDDSELGRPMEIGELLFDSDDTPFALIKYSKDDSWFLRWVRVDPGGAVLLSNVDSGNDDSYSARVADVVTDSHGGVHALYSTSWVDSILNYGFTEEMNGSDNWNVEMVTGENFGYGAFLALDRLDNPLVVLESDAHMIELARKVDDRWQFETVDERTPFGWHDGTMSAAVDSEGTVHAAYYAFDGHNADLMVYASSDTNAILLDALVYAGMLASVVAIVVAPTTIGFSIWTTRRRTTRDRKEQLGLYDRHLK